MDFSWTDTQAELHDRALAFARKNLNQSVRDRDREHRFGRQEWLMCADFGFQGLCVPERYGGMGLDVLTTARLIEALGRGCRDMGLVFSITSHQFACAVPILEFGSDEIKEAMLHKLCDGSWIGSTAMTEAEAGTDAFALQTRAIADGDDYLLTGTKTWATNAPIADCIIVYASTNPEHGYLGISAFVVETDRPGLAIGAPFENTGLTTAPSAAVYLTECRVPARNRLGAEGQGEQVFATAMRWERSCLFSAYLGLMEHQLDQVIAHASQRRQFGRPLAHFQAISHRIADMKLRLDAARLLLYRACWLVGRGEDATLEVGLAKVAVSEAAIQSGLDTIQIHGGNGVTREFDVERGLRDAIPATIASGTSESQRNLIARELGL